MAGENYTRAVEFPWTVLRKELLVLVEPTTTSHCRLASFSLDLNFLAILDVPIIDIGVVRKLHVMSKKKEHSLESKDLGLETKAQMLAMCFR